MINFLIFISFIPCHLVAASLFDFGLDSGLIPDTVRAKLLYSDKGRTMVSYFNNSSRKIIEIELTIPVCKNPDGTIQPFRLHKDEITNSLSVISIGATVAPGVVLFNSTICNHTPLTGPKAGEVIYPYIEGDIEIRNTYIEGGLILAKTVLPEEKDELKKIFIESSDLVGDYIVRDSAYLNNVRLTGNSVLEGGSKNRIWIENS